jgi:competence protein ComEA
MNKRAFQIVVWAAVLGFIFLSTDAGARAPQSRAELKVAGFINLNEASVDQLVLLPGIGDTKARAIVKYRTRRRFRIPRDLVRIKGIGRKTYRRLAPLLRTKGPTTLKSVAKR